MVAYNDSRSVNANPFNISGASVSTDGGTTFTRLTKANGHSPFENTVGDPVILYNKQTGTWLTVWIFDGQCGSGLRRVQFDHSVGIPIAGPHITALTVAVVPVTTASLAGLTTTRHRPSSGGYMFPGTTSV